MAENRVPDEREKKILLANHIDPNYVAVERSDDDYIRLLNYKTRDHIVIHRGDKKW